MNDEGNVSALSRWVLGLQRTNDASTIAPIGKREKRFLYVTILLTTKAAAKMIGQAIESTNFDLPLNEYVTALAMPTRLHTMPSYAPSRKY